MSEITTSALPTLLGRARTASGPATVITNARRGEDGRQMAFGLCRCVAPDGAPLVVVTIIHGDEQKTLTLDPVEMDHFAGALADAALWQNEELRRKAGQAVH